MMSDLRFPPEIWDHIVDFLHDQPETLKQCCLVSKSWVPRTRTHLFGEIAFSYHNNVNAWKETFPDPANSPAHYTHSLSLRSKEVIIVVSWQWDYWIRMFHNVVGLRLRTAYDELLSARSYMFIFYLPNLEDLAITNFGMSLDEDFFFQSSTSPLTGTLTVTWPLRMECLVTKLLALPNGIHFRKFKFSWDMESNVRWVMDLVEACSDTLEHVDIEPSVDQDTYTVLIDFSKATKLRSIVLRVEDDSVLWALTALKTISSEHRDLREVTIHIDFYTDSPTNLRPIIGEETYMQWMALDHVLVQLCKTDTVRVRVSSAGMPKGACGYAEALLPETTKGGTLQADCADLY